MFYQNSKNQQNNCSEKWGVKFGNSQWTLFKFLDKRSGFYIIPYMGHTGLHLSIHPSSQDFEYPHIHFKSEKLGIHEDVELDYSMFSPEYWLDKIESLISLFEPKNKVELGDGQILIVPNLNQLIEGTSNQHFFNLNSMIDGKYYMTEEKKVPSLRRKLKSNSLIGINKENQILFFDKDFQVRFEFDKISKTLFGPKDALSVSIENALNNITYQLKDNITINSPKIVPNNVIQEFEYMKRRRPKFQLIQY